MNMANERLHNYMKLTNGKLITQMLVKMSLFVTNKVFQENNYGVTTCRFAYFTYSIRNSVTSHGIDGFHSDVIRLQSQKSDVL